jgi:hypothetical protein
MKRFVDSGFLLTLLLNRSGSETAWRIVHRVESPLLVTSLQIYTIENRLQRELESIESSASDQAQAANALQNLRWLLDQQVLDPVRLDYNIAIDLALRWQRRAQPTVQALLLLWPALAVTIGTDEFLSFDPRTRQFAVSAGLKVLPEKL